MPVTCFVAGFHIVGKVSIVISKNKVRRERQLATCASSMVEDEKAARQMPSLREQGQSHRVSQRVTS